MNDNSKQLAAHLPPSTFNHDDIIDMMNLTDEEYRIKQEQKYGVPDYPEYEEEDLDSYYEIYNRKYSPYIEDDRNPNDSSSDDIGDLLASDSISIESLAGGYEYDLWIEERRQYIFDKKRSQPLTEEQLKRKEQQLAWKNVIPTGECVDIDF